jgi:DNA polymerase-3 subunit delta
MKLSGAAANRYFRTPDAGAAGLLVYGADPMRVALKRQEVIAALIGPQGESEMRLTRIQAADLRKDPALLLDAVKAVGFFPGARVALVEDATDGLTELLGAALKDWRAGDAQIIVTAGQLAAKSALRKLFESHPAAPAIGLYDDPPTREEIEDELKRAGLTRIDSQAMSDLTALARELDPGDFRQTLEKIALYKWRDDTPLTPVEVVACAPATIEAEIDDVLHAAAEGETARIGPLMRRLEGQGIAPVRLCIGALQHFRALHAAASDPGGVASGIARMRPPIFGPRRDRLQRQAQNWHKGRLEEALALILDTDLTLRSTSKAPAYALVERALIRLTMMRRR